MLVTITDDDGSQWPARVRERSEGRKQTAVMNFTAQA